MKKRGFTLMELLVAMAILAILSAIVVSVYRSYVKKAALSALKADTRNCVTCVASELARVALTGGNPNFDNCTKSKSKYTQSCSPSSDSNNDIGWCECSGAGIVSGVTCKLYTNSTSFEGTGCD